MAKDKARNKLFKFTRLVMTDKEYQKFLDLLSDYVFAVMHDVANIYKEVENASDKKMRQVRH